ncbi:MAG: B12-binding domain-containing radical SAM protein, partial [Hornefia butyriciproducens]|nr:B12-binding domain-containing radical SAM protein [Hornefia butyriciproducens]
MRILLTTLNSKYIHTNLSLKYLYSVVADSGLDVELREFTINNERDLVFGEIMRGGYDLVCFSCYVWNIEQIRSLCSDLKKA